MSLIVSLQSLSLFFISGADRVAFLVTNWHLIVSDDFLGAMLQVHWTVAAGNDDNATLGCYRFPVKFIRKFKDQFVFRSEIQWIACNVTATSASQQYVADCAILGCKNLSNTVHLLFRKEFLNWFLLHCTSEIFAPVFQRAYGNANCQVLIRLILYVWTVVIGKK